MNSKKRIAVSMAVYFMMAMAAIAEPLNISWCLEYMTTNAPNSKWMLQDDGQGVYIKQWSSTLPKPTIAEASAVWAEAAPWKSNQVNTAKADFDGWDKPELKALVLVLMDEINILRTQAGLPPRTTAQLKAAIKGKL
jgi:hypothetical protein